MAVKQQPLDWPRCFGSLCDTPLEPVLKEALDAEHPALSFDRHWRALSTDGMPLRSALRPDRIKPILKWLMIMETRADGKGRYVVRLHGTAAAAMMYGDYTGRELAEFTVGECYATRRRAMDKAIHDATPLFGRAEIEAEGKPRIEVMLGMYPFALPDETSYQLVVVVAPSDPALRRLL